MWKWLSNNYRAEIKDKNKSLKMFSFMFDLNKMSNVGASVDFCSSNKLNQYKFQSIF